MNPESKITIFTDGSSRGNPGPGGFGAIIVHNDGEFKVTSEKWKVKELGGREEHTTNNRMELRAAIEALTFIQNQDSTLPARPKSDAGGNREKDRILILYSDSAYVINGITKWVHGWKKNNWITSQKKPVENRDLWEQLDSLCTIYRTEWKQVGGHVGVAGNERCDEIATAFADGNRPELYSGVLENYGIKNILEIPQGRTLNPQKGPTLKKQHSHAKAYSYVSMVGGKILTHKTWSECEARVKGKPARYKKAVSVENEKEIIAEFSSDK